MAFALLAVNVALVWVATGPRSLDAYNQYIEKALSNPQAGYSIRIQHSMVLWDGWKNPIDIRVEKLDVLSKEGIVFASFPKVSLGLDMGSFFLGQVKLKSLKIKQPILSLYQTPEGDITFGVGEDNTQSFSLMSLLSGSGEQSDSMVSSHIKTLIIEDANLSIGNSQRGVFFKAPRTQIRFVADDEGAKGYLDLGVQYEEKNSLIAGEFSYKKSTQSITGKLVFSEVRPYLLSNIFTLPDAVKAIQLSLSGVVELRANTKGEVSALDFYIKSGAGKIDYPAAFDAPLPVNKISLHGTIVEQLSTIILHDSELEFDGPVFSLSGVFTRRAGDYFIDMYASGKGMPVKDLHYYWPKSLAPITRDWVTTRITDGVVPEAFIRLVMQPGYMAYAFPPRDAIDSAVKVDGATIEYMPGHPKVTEAKGVVYFDGRQMDITVESAKNGVGSVVKQTMLQVPDLTAADTQMLVNLNIDAAASDIANFLKQPDINLADRMNLKASEIKGRAEGNIKLDFIAFTEKPRPVTESMYDNVAYDITADLKDVSQRAFLKKYDIDAFNGKVTLNNAQLDLRGDVVMDKEKLALVYQDFNTKDAEFTSIYSIKGSLPASKLQSMGYLTIPAVSGRLGVDALIKEKGEHSTTEANIDFKNAAINAEAIGLVKPLGTDAKLTLKTLGATREDALKVTLKSNGIDIAGTIFTKAGDFTKLDLSRVIYGKTDASVLYAPSAEQAVVRVKGNSLDLSPYFTQQKGSSDYSFSKFPAVKMAVDVKTLVLDTGRSLNHVKAEVECEKVICPFADVAAVLPGKGRLTFSITQDKGRRHINIGADNAGEALSTLGIHDGIVGGTLSLRGWFDDAQATHPLNGRLVMNNYALRTAPILAKLVSLASLTGFFNTLGGKGIRFDKLAANFRLENDIIYLKDGRAAGDALGLTAKGTLALKGVNLDLDGTVVPSYTLNSMVGKIPLVGEVLTGGSGQGLIAANYSIKGPHTDPQVMVNPLSILTPGFLRGFFEIFDQPADVDGGEASTTEKKNYNKKKK